MYIGASINPGAGGARDLLIGCCIANELARVLYKQWGRARARAIAICRSSHYCYRARATLSLLSVGAAMLIFVFIRLLNFGVIYSPLSGGSPVHINPVYFVYDSRKRARAGWMERAFARARPKFISRCICLCVSRLCARGFLALSLVNCDVSRG